MFDRPFPLMAVGGYLNLPRPTEIIVCTPRVAPQWGYWPDEEQVRDGRVDVCFYLLQSRAAQWG